MNIEDIPALDAAEIMLTIEQIAREIRGYLQEEITTATLRNFRIDANCLENLIFRASRALGADE